MKKSKAYDDQYEEMNELFNLMKDFVKEKEITTQNLFAFLFTIPAQFGVMAELEDKFFDESCDMLKKEFRKIKTKKKNPSK